MKRTPSTILVFVLIMLGVFFSFYNIRAQTESITATVKVSSVCGNDEVEGSEQCDGTALAGEDCISQGYDGGTLACKTDCSGFDTSSCTTDTGNGGNGGGGGGGGWAAPTTKVVLQGLVYPGAELTILKDGQVATGSILADSQGNFKVTLTILTAGTYTFGIWAEDKQGRRSITFSFTVTVTQGMTTTIGGIFIPPTIELDKTGVKGGDILNILGQSAPQSEITIKVNSPGEIIKTTTTTDGGDWDFPLDTSPLEKGVHYTKAKAVTDDGLESSYSKTLTFYIGKEVAPGEAKKADINNDNKVNLVDFSILLYNWGTPRNTASDFNDDGWVNLVDFSIMMYQWTG